MSKKSAQKIAGWLMVGNTITYLFMIVINFLANYLPINGVTTGEISEYYQNIFTPAGFTFAIWGIIYLLLLLLIVFLFRGLLRKNERIIQIIHKISGYLMISSLLNGAWIFSWHYDRIFLSLVIMLALLVSLIQLNRSFNILPESGGIYRIPVSVYLSWITVATLANITVFAVSREWGQLGLPDEFWFVVLLLIVVIIAAVMILKQRDIAYGLVILWALGGIFVARFSVGNGLTFPAVITLIAGLFVITFLTAGMRKLVV